MVVIPNGIDTERFRPDAEAGRCIQEEWKVDRGDVLIGLVGRLDPMKDHPTFLKAASLLLKQRQDVRFVCIGRITSYNVCYTKLLRMMPVAFPTSGSKIV